MKSVLRGLVYEADTEKDNATDNYKRVERSRFVSLLKADEAVLDYLLEFYQKYAEAPQLQSVYNQLEKDNQVEEVMVLEEVLTEQFLEGASFQDLLEAEVEQQAAERLTRTLKQGIKIANAGETLNKIKIKGTDAALAFIFAESEGKPADQEGRMPARIQDSQKELVELYEKRRKNPQETYGVPTGYGLYDSATAGIRKKQLYIHAGFGGHLKSTMMMNMILNASVDGGWNTLLFSSEMPADDIKLMLVAMHSANPVFSNQGKPISTFSLLLGNLEPTQEMFFKLVNDDLANNKNYGSIRVVDSGEFTTFGSIMQRTVREHAEEEVDMMWMDYLTRLPLDSKYRSENTTLARNETIADAKRFAMAFDGGGGLAVATPFQINREGFKRAATEGGRMDLTALGQYNAAEKEADVVTYVFFGVEEQATSEPKIGVLKSRWGKVDPDPVAVFIEPDSRRMFDLTAGLAPVSGYAPTGAVEAEDEIVL